LSGLKQTQSTESVINDTSNMEVIIIQNDTHTLEHLLSMDVAKCPLFSLTNIHQLLHNSISTLIKTTHDKLQGQTTNWCCKGKQSLGTSQNMGLL